MMTDGEQYKTHLPWVGHLVEKPSGKDCGQEEEMEEVRSRTSRMVLTLCSAACKNC